MHKFVTKKYREYELVYVLAPTTTPALATKVSEIIEEVVVEDAGKIVKVKLWGIRKLAYHIRSHGQGIYYHVRFIATQAMIDELERRLKLSDPVLRYLTVRLSKHEVDPADYTVAEEEVKFEGIDDIHARITSPAPEVGEEAGGSGDETTEDGKKADDAQKKTDDDGKKADDDGKKADDDGKKADDEKD